MKYKMHWISLTLYLFSSSLLMIINPVLFGKYNWPSALLLTAIQNIGMVILCCMKEQFNKLVYGLLSPKLLLIAHISVINIVFAMIGSSFMSLAMFTALRRVSIACTMYGNALVGNDSWPSVKIQWCVWVMIIGAAFSAYRDAVFDIVLYSYVMINNFCTATVQVGTKSALKGVSKWELLFVSAIVNWVWCFIMIGPRDVANIEWSTPLLFTLSGSFVGGICVNVSSAWVIEKDGPLALSMVGASKNIFLGLLSIVGLAGATYVYDFWNVIGLSIAASASVAYAIIKNRPDTSKQNPEIYKV